ncbi:hypothetical protein [Brenneria uluponensis]|uniref:hypothetical protein n=1 Tax=Brenneria uluponensis TaxID=3057057 RepID=UPI0028F00244|nr:hypothetical protein [Brenneria ulupoensis]
MNNQQLAYIDDEGDLIVIDEYDGKIVVALDQVNKSEDIVHQLWRLTSKNNYKSEALKLSIEIMAKKIGMDPSV